MQVILEGSPISANYGGNLVCFTGAHAQGEVILTLPDGREQRKNFNEIISPSPVTTDCHGPNEAPITLASTLGLLDAFSQLWSYDFLAAPIQSRAWYLPITRMAVELCTNNTIPAWEGEKLLKCLVASATTENTLQLVALGKLQYLGEKAMPAIPDLISLLEASNTATPGPSLFSPSESVSQKVVETLQVISGQDFGNDASRWWSWWNSTH